MAEPSTTGYVIGVFNDPQSLMEAARRACDARWPEWDCHTPHPVHGLDKAMGLKDSYVPYITLTAGFTGAVFAKTMQWFMSDYDYPLMVGGTPLFAVPAFVPVTFELFVLFGAALTFVSLILICRLGRWRSPLREAGVMELVTSCRYAIVLSVGDAAYGEGQARELLEASGCRDVRTVGGGGARC